MKNTKSICLNRCEVIFIIGFPGAGKTTYIGNHYSQGYIVYDDYKAVAINESNHFIHSRHFYRLITNLYYKARVVISDIDFCRKESFDEAFYILRLYDEYIHIKYIIFEKNKEKCLYNIEKRGRKNILKDKNGLEKYYEGYKYINYYMPITIVNIIN